MPSQSWKASIVVTNHISDPFFFPSSSRTQATYKPYTSQIPKRPPSIKLTTHTVSKGKQTKATDGTDGNQDGIADPH